MKKKIIVILQILILLICNVHIGVIAESSNLMDNGGFERDLTSWRTNINESVSKISTYAYSGNKSLKLTGQESEQFLYYYVNNVDINKSYELSAYVKAENLTKDGFYMAILPVDSKNRALGWYFVNEFSEHKAINKTSGTHDWKRISHVVDGKSFDEKTVKLQIYCFMDSNTHGSVLVDDISFKIADVNVYPEFERMGNIIVSDEDTAIPLICENNSAYGKNICVNYVITDDRNMQLAEGQDSFSVKALCMEKHNVSVPIDKYGAYDVELTISDDDGFLKTQKVRFCKIMKDNSQSVSDDIGVAMHNSRFSYHNTPADEYYKAFKTAGCSFIRDELRWEDVEKVKGQYGVTDKIEETYSAIIANNLKALVILGYGNTLYDMENIAIVPTTEEQLKGFENYVHFTVDYLKKKGFSKENLVFEVWNEYSGGMSNKTGVSDEHYVNLISIVKKVTEEIMPGVPVMTEGMAHVINGGGKKRFQTYCDTNAVDYADVLGMHPYSRPNQPDEDNLFEGAVDDFRNILKASGKEDRPIYHSEVGWCVYKDDKYTEYSERESAVSMLRLFTLNKKMQKKYNQNDVLIIYKGANQNYSKSTEQYGILDFPWDESGKLNAKLPYVTLNTAVSLIDDATFVESNEDENLKIYRFKKSDGRDLLVMWTEEESEDISLDCNGTPEIYDMAGNPTDACVTEGSFNLCVTREPVIVMGSLDDIEPEYIEVYAKGSKTVISGEKAYITFNIDEARKEININPELPYGWEWENSYETFYGGKENTLIFKTPKSDKDSLNSIKLNFAVDNSEYINKICEIEVLADTYGKNLVTDCGMEGNEWQISNSSFARVDRAEYHSGSQSIKLTGVNGDKNAVYVSSPLPEITLDESGKYLMSLWMKASGNNDIPVRLVLNSQDCWIHEQMIKPSDEWIKYSVEVDLSENHTGKIYNFTVETTDDFEGTLWIDDAALVKVYDGDEYKEELLKNPGMESEEWWASLGKSGTTELSKEDKRNGFQSMKMVPGAWVRSEIFEVDDDTLYNFSMWLKGQNRVLLYVTAFDENMNELPSIWGGNLAYGTCVYDDSKNPPIRDDWSKASVDVTPDTYVEGTKYIRMAFRVLAGEKCENTPVYADDASMIKKTIQGDIQNVNTWTLSGATIDKENVEDEKEYIKMKNSDTAISLPFKVDYGRKYMLSAYVKSEQAIPGAFAFRTGTDDKVFRDEFYFTPRQNRVKYSTVVDFSDRRDSENFYIMLVTGNEFKGNVWIDDICFEPVDEKAADTFCITDIKSGTAKAQLHGEREMSATICWTIRDSQGRLKECRTDVVSIGIGFNEFYAEFNKELLSGDTVSVFVWDNFNKMIPLKLSDEYIIK